MDNLFKYLLLVILTTMVFSCQNRPSEVMPRKKMENVMYDMYIAEAIIDNDYQKFSQAETKEALISQVLEKHKITEARWDTSLSWYSDNIDTYLQINDSVKSRLQRNQNATNQLISLQAAENNELVIHPAHYIPNNFYIASLGCDRGFKFSLDSLQLVERFGDNDSIFFQFNVMGVLTSDFYSLKSMLMIEYADTTVFQSSDLNENKLYSFPLSKHIEQDTIVSLNGFINLSGKFPHVPIQLYKISLGNDAAKDSTEILNKPINDELMQQPKMVTD